MPTHTKAEQMRRAMQVVNSTQPKQRQTLIGNLLGSDKKDRKLVQKFVELMRGGRPDLVAKSSLGKKAQDAAIKMGFAPSKVDPKLLSVLGKALREVDRGEE